VTEPTPGGMPNMLVLDSTAVIGFTRSSIHVGEVLSEMADDNGIAIIPAVCLMEALPSVADRDRLAVLVKHPAVRVASEDMAEWRTLGELRDIVGRLDAACACLLALDLDVSILSRTPLVYAGVDTGRLVIAIEE
jgi:hypothetical protein